MFLLCERIALDVLLPPATADWGFKPANGAAFAKQIETQSRGRRPAATMLLLRSPKTNCCLRRRGAASAICKRRGASVVVLVPLLLEGETKNGRRES